RSNEFDPTGLVLPAVLKLLAPKYQVSVSHTEEYIVATQRYDPRLVRDFIVLSRPLAHPVPFQADTRHIHWRPKDKTEKVKYNQGD
ncbi:MAG: hypothetical protein ACC663_01885, partial [Gammaproteobacteria bacterium]